jgi:hypothetical protein
MHWPSLVKQSVQAAWPREAISCLKMCAICKRGWIPKEISECNCSESRIGFRISGKSAHGTIGIAEYPTVHAKYSAATNLPLASTRHIEPLPTASDFCVSALPAGRAGGRQRLHSAIKRLINSAQCFPGFLWRCLSNRNGRSEDGCCESYPASQGRGPRRAKFKCCIRNLNLSLKLIRVGLCRQNRTDKGKSIGAGSVCTKVKPSTETVLVNFLNFLRAWVSQKSPQLRCGSFSRGRQP